MARHSVKCEWSVITPRMLQTKNLTILVLERHPYYIRMPSMSHLPSFKEGIVHESPSYTGRISFESSNEGCDKGTHNGFG